MFRLAHFSDVHLAPLPAPRLRDLVSKRLIGYANWRLNRAREMTAQSLDRLLADVRTHNPDHIVVTGDLANIALYDEFEAARRWLEMLGPPANVTVIPGNHDAYVPGAHRHYRRLWAPWMTGDDGDPGEDARFPFLRRRDGIALIGVSSAVASAPFMATGRIGPGQAEKLAVLLEETGAEGLTRVVLIHHPPKLMDWRGFTRRLTDAGRFRSVIQKAGAELVLHGHDHRATTITISGPDGPVPVAGAAAGSGPPGGGHKPGGYAIHEISTGKDAVQVTVIHRCFDADGAIVETARDRFALSLRC
jgi:3',5'-cyclic AMP phosphodiesterase CpdA